MSKLSRFIAGAALPVRGPSPSFEPSHLLYFIMMIGDAGMLGRAALARQSNLGEGSARTIIRRLTDSGIIGTDASGCHLTPAGKKFYDEVNESLSRFTPLAGAQLTLGKYQMAIAVRGGGDRVTTGIEQRDSAIRLRASGATTYFYKGGKFTVPGGSVDCEKDFPSQAWSLLRRSLKPKGGDAIVLSGAEDETTAKLGALAAASTLL